MPLYWETHFLASKNLGSTTEVSGSVKPHLQRASRHSLHLTNFRLQKLDLAATIANTATMIQSRCLVHGFRRDFHLVDLDAQPY